MVKGIGKAERAQGRRGCARFWWRLPGYGARRPGNCPAASASASRWPRAGQSPKVLAARRAASARLDLKLRENMQEELKTLQKSLGITFVFVNPRPGRGAVDGRRFAVFNDGRIMAGRRAGFEI